MVQDNRSSSACACTSRCWRLTAALATLRLIRTEIFPKCETDYTRVRKTRLQMEEAGLDAASMDLWKFGVMRRYRDRPDNSEDVCLTDFGLLYNVPSY